MSKPNHKPHNPMKPMLITTLLASLLFYTVLVGIVFLIQDRIIYFPFREVEQTPQDIGLAFDEVILLTSDHQKLQAWFIPAPDAHAVILFCHGNAGNISHRLDILPSFRALGFSTFLFDYRGYGNSTGKPSESGTYRDAEAAYDYLTSQARIASEKIIVFGESIGCGVAVELALRRRVGALVLLAGFTSLPELGQQLYPWLPVKLLAKHRYASIEKLQHIVCPKLIIHSPEDEIVPFRHGKALFEKACPPKEFLEIKGGHNDWFLVSGGKVSEGLKNFFDKYVAHPRPWSQQ